LAVPNYDEERAFVGGPWGLTEVAADTDARVSYFAARPSTGAYLLRLRAAARRQVDLFAFAAVDRAGVLALHGRLRTGGARLLGEPAPLTSPGGGFGFRFFDLDGRLVEVSSDVAPREAQPLAPKAGRPAGLAHVVFHAPDV